jgi:hypothetical protein
MISFNSDTFPNLSDQDPRWLEYVSGNFLMSKLFQPISSVPKNNIGLQEPHKGNNYYCLVAINNLLKCPGSQNYELQSYAQIKLHQKLRKKNAGYFVCESCRHSRISIQ